MWSTGQKQSKKKKSRASARGDRGEGSSRDRDVRSLPPDLDVDYAMPGRSTDQIQRGLFELSTGPDDESSDDPGDEPYESGEYVVKSREFFETRGRVLAMMWSEPSSSLVSRRDITKGAQDQMVHQKKRYFIVWLAKPQHCLAVAIHTYLGRGAGNKRGTKHHHGIVHTGKIPPSALAAELPCVGERGMQPEAIRVNPDDPAARLDILSRINYSKIYTIEYNIPVKNFGTIVPNSLGPFFQQLDDVLDLKSLTLPSRGVALPAFPQAAPVRTELQRPRAPSTQTSHLDDVQKLREVTKTLHASLMRDKNFTKDEADEFLRNWLASRSSGTE